jgi:hypothetical protein
VFLLSLLLLPLFLSSVFGFSSVPSDDDEVEISPPIGWKDPFRETASGCPHSHNQACSPPKRSGGGNWKPIPFQNGVTGAGTGSEGQGKGQRNGEKETKAGADAAGTLSANKQIQFHILREKLHVRSQLETSVQDYEKRLDSLREEIRKYSSILMESSHVTPSLSPFHTDSPLLIHLLALRSSIRCPVLSPYPLQLDRSSNQLLSFSRRPRRSTST